MTYYNQALSISLIYPIRKEQNPLATKKYAIRYWQLLKNFLIKTRQLCETGDGMQKMRSRLFQYWFSIYNEREEYLFPPQIVYDEEENENYAALIIRKDNPCFVELVSEFTDTINLLNGKPE